MNILLYRTLKLLLFILLLPAILLLYIPVMVYLYARWISGADPEGKGFNRLLNYRIF